MAPRFFSMLLCTAAVAALPFLAAQPPAPESKPGFATRPAPNQSVPGQAHAQLPTVHIASGTPLPVRLNHSGSTADRRAGATFTATLVQPVSADGDVVLPKGTQVSGHVVDSVQPGRLKGQGRLT